MGKYIKLFETHSQYEAFTQTEDFLLPNVSYCENITDEVHYNPYVMPEPPEPPETRVVATFNIEQTSYGTLILNAGYNTGTLPEELISEIEIDGVVINGIPDTYTFTTTGEHTVKYTLIDDTSIPVRMFYNCGTLTAVYLPDTIISIEDYAFFECTNLSSITCMTTSTIPGFGNNVFDYVSYNGTLYVPSDNVSDYEDYFISGGISNWQVEGI